jgi:hypothetical protein
MRRRALPRAARPHRVHAVAHRLQRGHPRAASVDLRPCLPPVVGGPQFRPERPAVAEVQEPDLAHAAPAARAAAGGAPTVRQLVALVLALSVRCSTTQAGAAGRSHCLAGSAGPITQPVEVPTNVTDSGGGSDRVAGSGRAVEASMVEGLDATGSGAAARPRGWARRGQRSHAGRSPVWGTPPGDDDGGDGGDREGAGRREDRATEAAPAGLPADALERVRRWQQRLHLHI